MSYIRCALSALLVLASPFTFAAEFIYDTHNGDRLTLEQFVSQRQAGEIVVFGEEHAVQGQEDDPSTIAHHRNQVRLLEALNAAVATGAVRYHVTTAMEFLTYPTQSYVDQYGAGALSETEFLKQSGWDQGNPFSFYRDQILAPYKSGSHTVALNIPRQVTSQVAKGGPDSLTDAEKAFLPPIWERGGAEYFERFKELMEESGHIPDDAVDRYFWAQSLWDDTMAWKALSNLAADPQALTVIIVGGFHVEFGHGLPARLVRQRADSVVKTMLQVEAPNLDDGTVAPLLAPDAKYGPHADYLWVHTLN